MKKAFLLIPFLFLSLIVIAQSPDPVTLLNQDSAVVPKKVLIIPYNPMMHISDADHDIAEYSEKSLQQVRAMFRIGISKDVNKQLAAVYQSHDMLADMRPQVFRDLEMIYGSVNYSYDTVFSILHPVLDSASIANKISLKQQTKKELEKRNKTGDVKYMNVKLSHLEVLDMLAKKYDVDYFIFLNQFEIKTNHDECISMSTKQYMRDLKVHYSIYNKNGEQLYGDVIIGNSASNEIGEIMAKSFPPLGGEIVHRLPLATSTKNQSGTN